MHLFLLFKSNSIKKKLLIMYLLICNQIIPLPPWMKNFYCMLFYEGKLFLRAPSNTYREKMKKKSCVCTTATYSLARTSNPGQKLVKMTVSSKEEKSVNIHEYKSSIFFTENILKGKLGIKYWISKKCKYRT